MSRADSGFTLIEVLVALVVTAILLAILLDGSQTAGRVQQRNQEDAAAIILGRTIMARVAASNQPLADAQGQESRLRWTVQEQPLQTDPRGFYELVEVKLNIADMSGKPVRSFVTRKLRRMQRL